VIVLGLDGKTHLRKAALTGRVPIKRHGTVRYSLKVSVSQARNRNTFECFPFSLPHAV
jgi:hypothetical protein